MSLEKQVTRICFPSCYLSIEMVMEIPFLVLSAQQIHDFSVFWSAGWTLGITFCITFKAVLVKGVATQEVYRWKLQGAVTHVALSLLEYLGTVWKHVSFFLLKAPRELQG